MYIAEGSDWFWWYGADQNSGNDESFDQLFRDTLKAVYEALGAEPPAALDIQLIPEHHGIERASAATGLIDADHRRRRGPRASGCSQAVYGGPGRTLLAATWRQAISAGTSPTL